MNKLLILTEAGGEIGLGHYIRCSAIQESIIDAGGKCTLILDLQGKLNLSINGIVFPWLTDSSILNNFEHFDTVLIDSYLLTYDGYKNLKQWFKKIIVFDDYNRIIYPADLLINPNIYFERSQYKNQSAYCIGGNNYVILRKPFREFEPVFNENQTDSLLITVGGKDTRNLLEVLCEIGLSLGFRNITAICPDDLDRSKIENISKYIQVKGLLSAEEILVEYSKASVVISASGSTLHELARMGKPTVGICIAIDQEKNQEFYFKNGFLHQRIQWNDNDFSDKVKSSLNTFKRGSYGREYFMNATKLVGKSGADNIISKIFPGRTQLTFRLANTSDCEMYFTWANDPVVRRSAKNSEQILLHDHKKWFEDKLNSKSLLLVFVQNNFCVGQVRIDWEDDGCGVIDFSVDSDFRGRGIGSLMLYETVKLIESIAKPIRIKGYVKKENIASARAFENAGFLSMRNTIDVLSEYFIFMNEINEL